MGYRITYSNGIIEKKLFRDRRINWKRIPVIFATLAVAVTLAVPSGRLWLRNILLPGDEDVTAAALESLVEDLYSGESVGEAVQTFCREILTGDGA